MLTNPNRVLIFDTTMRDGELMPGVRMNLTDKIRLAQLLEAMGADIIEVSYPGQSAKDFEEISAIAPLLKQATICGLASSQETDIVRVAQGIQAAAKGRIHTYTNVGLNREDKLSQGQTLETIRASVALARNYCDDVEWSAFDATRSDPDFLCKAVETAIASGANTVNIPDSLGKATPEEFSRLIDLIFNWVPNLERAVVSVHCHDDLGMAVANSLAALQAGARQIECSINGLGARKGNAALEQIVREIVKQNKYQINLNPSLLERASELVGEITLFCD